MNSDKQGPYNVGAEQHVTINGLVKMVAGIAGKDVIIKHIPGPQGVRGRSSNNNEIYKDLGWKPTEDLESGLKRRMNGYLIKFTNQMAKSKSWKSNLQCTDTPLSILACEIDGRTGEGNLAKIALDIFKNKHFYSNINFLSPTGKIYEKHHHTRYLWLWVQLVWLSIFKPEQRILVLNYLPIWNFVTFMLAPSSTLFGPITGGGLVNRKILNLPVLRMLPTLFLRNILLPCLSKLSVFFIRLKKLKVAPGTREVGRIIDQTVEPPLFIFSDPAPLLSARQKLQRKKTGFSRPIDIIVYTNSHVLKNNFLLTPVLAILDNADLKIVLIDKHNTIRTKFSNVTVYREIDKEKLYEIFSRTKVAMQLSAEAAGSFGYEAACHGVSVFGFPNTGPELLPSFLPLSNRDEYPSAGLIAQQVMSFLQTHEIKGDCVNLINAVDELHVEAKNYFSRNLFSD